jgi:hypothetical protein
MGGPAGDVIRPGPATSPNMCAWGPDGQQPDNLLAIGGADLRRRTAASNHGRTSTLCVSVC